MTSAKIIGWKNYLLAVACIATGLVAFHRGNTDGGVKGLLAGFAIITLRDVFRKVLEAVEANRQSLDDLRAAIEADLSTRGRS